MKTIWKSLRFSWLFVWKANRLFALLYLAIELFCATLPLLQVYFLNLVIDAVLLGQINKTLDSALFWGISILLGVVLEMCIRDSIWTWYGRGEHNNEAFKS